MSLAFRQVGQRVSEAARETHREIDVVALVSLAAAEHQQDAAKTTCQRILVSPSPPAFVLQFRKFDSTPLKVRFGALQTSPGGFARYWHRDRSQAPGHQWRLVSADELKA